MIMKSNTPYNFNRPKGRKLDGTKIRVLIVDDSVFVQKQLAQILTSEEFEIAGVASDGVEGIKKYKELFPNVDVVTMDITMPCMDGIQTLDEILKFNDKANVVMITALGKESLVRQALTIGAKNYIVKPLERKKVIDRLSIISLD